MPAMSDITSNLRKCLKKDVLFQWTDNPEKDFQELKNKISIDAHLQYNNLSKPVILQADISKRLQGVVHIQKDSQCKHKPATYISKSLTSNETRYANI